MTSHFDRFTPVASFLPEGEKGIAKVDHFEVSEENSRSTQMREVFRPGSYVPAGKYARLTVGRVLMMTDTKMEQRTNLGVVSMAKGDVLIAGLGIGMVLVPVLKKPEVKSVTVIEKYQDVVDLVVPAIMASVPEAKDKLNVIVADALEWTPPKGVKYDTIYFDIWPEICADNLEDIKLLKRRYARRKNPGAWVGAWVEDEIRYQEREAKRRMRLLALNPLITEHPEP